MEEGKVILCHRYNIDHSTRALQWAGSSLRTDKRATFQFIHCYVRRKRRKKSLTIAKMDGSTTGSADKIWCCCIASGVTTGITWIIGVSITWIYSQVVYKTPVSFAAAFIITLPVFVFVIGFIVTRICNCEIVAEGAYCCFVFFVSISSILDIVGVILLIVSMVNAAKELGNPAGAIACGTFATIFVFISAIFNCATFAANAQGSKIASGNK